MTTTQATAHPLLERLAGGELIIGDGATGTYLQSHGLEPGGCPEALNESQPDLVKEMAREYFDAGSNLVFTNTFGGSRFMQKKYGLRDKVHEFNKLAAQHARSQAREQDYVIGSVGPSGEFIEPLGEVTYAEMVEAFEEQITGLKEGGADGVVIETMTALEESKAAIEAAQKVGGLVIMATMTFDRGPRGFFTMMGVTPERAAKELRAAGADVVGSNCGSGIEGMIEIARQIRDATDGFVMINSNAGIPAIQKGLIVYPETPEFMAEKYVVLAEMGINILGGCCGTTPGHITALCKAVGK
ncbi:MAG: homocysteine S-methyltransferase family protein [Chloroflexi bacterium]|nr:homocysteine S-methyltransferase family protein [Chloroflexota bacterium]